MLKIKEEKGSITLIVIVTMLFITILLIGILVSNSNANITSKQATQQIKENYEKDVNNIEQVYETALYNLGLNAAEIASNPTVYYGKEVTYTPQNGATEDWKIFYADEENIYLIASDYVENTYAPNAANGTAPNKDGHTNYCVYFTDIVSSYTGTEDIQTEDERVTKWISHINSFTSTNNNMKVTAYLLDTSIWKGFQDANNKAEYVIGGPTLELFIASYNDTHETDINREVTDTVGYKVKWSTDTDYSYDVIGLDATEKLYINDSTHTNAYGYWLASPSAYGSDFVFGLGCDQTDVGYDVIDNIYLSLRPIICLKSSTQLMEQADGTYVIQ